MCLYGCQLWYMSSKSIDKFIVVWHKCVRKITFHINALLPTSANILGSYGGGGGALGASRDWGDFMFCHSWIKILFSMTCDGSICRDACCFKFIFREAWWDHLIIHTINTQFPTFKMCLFALDAGRECDFFYLFPVIEVFYFLWSVMGIPSNTHPPYLSGDRATGFQHVHFFL